MRYHVIDHTADLRLRIFGKTAGELFVNGVYALFDLLTDLDQVQLKAERSVTASGTDWPELWVNYLRECLYVYNGEGLLIRDCVILSLDRSQVTARLRGEAFEPSRHQIKQEIKAVTYHQASVQTTVQGWKGKVILDV